jgi:hypothetical protein
LASEASGALSGRLISATADDWTALEASIPEVMAADAFLLRRVELS